MSVSTKHVQDRVCHKHMIYWVPFAIDLSNLGRFMKLLDVSPVLHYILVQ